MDFWRQLDIISPQQLQTSISVIGCGGIGSPTVLALSKMGCGQITVYDPDRVEAHNLHNQFFRLDDRHQAKVTALTSIVQSFTGTEIRGLQEKVVEQRLQGLVIGAVDSMDSRKKIWKNCIRFNPEISLYIDARMSSEVCRIFSIRPIDPEEVYHKTPWAQFSQYHF